MNCPKCQKPLKARTGPFGNFMGCTGYPECKYVFKEKKGGYPSSPQTQNLTPRTDVSNQDPMYVISQSLGAIIARLEKIQNSINIIGGSITTRPTESDEELTHIKDIPF